MLETMLVSLITAQDLAKHDRTISTMDEILMPALVQLLTHSMATINSKESVKSGGTGLTS